MTGTVSAERRSYAHAHVNPQWLAMVQEPVIEPDLPIIDPHHHLWHDRPSGRYMVEDLAADLASGHKVVGTVFLQCGWRHRQGGPEALRPAGETEAVNAAAVLFATGAYGTAQGCAGIVGFADLRRPDLDAVLDAHEQAGGGRFRGVRHGASWDDAILPTSTLPQQPGLLRDPAFQRGLRRLGERGLTFDAWQFHPQLQDLLEAARSAPGTMLVVNHVGGPLGCGPYRDRREEVVRTWSAGMQALAACPNVFVKLGGLGMPVNGFDYHTQPAPPSSSRLAEDWRPFMAPCLDWFGPERCMFESNFPVDKGMFSYPVLWNAFKRLAADASPAEKASLFHNTAQRFYRLQVG
ncbi:MAG: amidohydrolase family protein [Acetobacteraceae bacterium]